VSLKKHVPGWEQGLAGYAIPKAIVLWQPRVGQRVRVVCGAYQGDTKFIGKCGEVVRNKGCGLFLIDFGDGQHATMASKLLCDA
jgi:hypothetical protein